MYFNLDSKYARTGKGKPNPNPFIDPNGYKKFVAQTEHDFYTLLAKQKAQTAGEANV